MFLATPDLHFVAVPGSLRQASFTRAIAGTLDELAPDNVAVDVLNGVGNMPLYDQDLHDAGFPNIVEEIGGLIAGADALIIVTPEYNHSIPGGLKNALDWLSRLPRHPLAGKAIAIQTASPGLLGGARAYEHVRQVLVAMDGRVLNRPEVIVTQAAGKIDLASGLVRDEQTRRLLAEQLGALAELASRPLQCAA